MNRTLELVIEEQKRKRMNKTSKSRGERLTSDAFNRAVASEARRAATRLEVVVDDALGVHAAGLWQCARVRALAFNAELVQRAFLIDGAGRLANARVAVSVRGAVGGMRAWNRKWSAPDAIIERLASVAGPANTRSSVRQ